MIKNWSESLVANINFKDSKKYLGHLLEWIDGWTVTQTSPRVHVFFSRFCY